MISEPSRKQKLTLSVDSEIIKKAEEFGLNKSEITERVLRAFTSNPPAWDKKKLYEMYQDLFNLMLPLLQKFKVSTRIGQDVIYGDQVSHGPDGEPDEEPLEIFDIWLEPHGGFTHEGGGPLENIEEIDPGNIFNPKTIVDYFLNSIQKGIDYRKEQFQEIEMAKTIIDAITKTTLSKSKKE